MTDTARFTELFFADQTLEDLLASLDGDAAVGGVWMLLTEAAAHMRQGEAERAVKLLLEVVAASNIETRISLWSWTALRRLGVHPKSHEADEIKGIVVQVPMENGIDVLAAYVDGTARYVNHSGKVIVWDIPDASITNTISKLLECSKALHCVVDAASTNHSVAGLVRVTLLTFDGNRFAEASMHSVASSPINQVLAVGADLMANLIKRSESMTQIIKSVETVRSCMRAK